MHTIKFSALGYLAMLLICLSMAGCKKDDAPEAMASYKNAAITAGVSYGDLSLQKTTLRDFLTRFGQGRASMVIEDEQAFELFYFNSQISFQFLITDACWKPLPSGALRKALGNINQLITNNPACGDMKLSGISVVTGDDFHENSALTLKWVFDMAGMNMLACEKLGQLGQLLAGQLDKDPKGCLEANGMRVYYTLPDDKIDAVEILFAAKSGDSNPERTAAAYVSLSDDKGDAIGNLFMQKSGLGKPALDGISAQMDKIPVKKVILYTPSG